MRIKDIKHVGGWWFGNKIKAPRYNSTLHIPLISACKPSHILSRESFVASDVYFNCFSLRFALPPGHTGIDLTEDVYLFVCLITLTLLCSKQKWGSKTSSSKDKQKTNEKRMKQLGVVEL